MKANNFSLTAYLDRIGFVADPKPDITTIREMMRCQLFSVPFENLDVQAGKIVSLVPEEIVDKIVGRKRGGYCYEVNGIFAMALESLGVPYQFVAARPMFYPARRPKTHMAIVLTLDSEQWLCDLGFGSHGIQAPLCLSHLDRDIRQDYDLFRLSKDRKDNYLLRAFSNGEWANQYEFNLSEQEWIDFVPANYLNSTHPEAIFVQKLVVILHNPKGRKILLGNVLTTIENNVSSTLTLDQERISSILSDEFGLSLSA